MAINGELGPKSDKIWRDAVMRAVKRTIEDSKGKQVPRLEKLADALVQQGLEGNPAALREIGDRLDGKSVAYVETTVKDVRNVRELTTSALLDVLNAARAAEQKDSNGKAGSVH